MAERYWDSEQERWVYRNNPVDIIEDALAYYEWARQDADNVIKSLENAGYVIVRADDE